MVSLTEKSFTFENDLWKYKIEHHGQELLIFIKGDAQLFDNRETHDLLAKFGDEIDQIEKQAREFSMNSEYLEDIVENGGLNLSSIHIDNWTNFLIWFNLGETSDRMLGVRRVDGNFDSVYCDPPD